MTTTAPEPVLKISAPTELTALNHAPFREQTRAGILPDHTRVDVDLRSTSFVDSSGLGALICIHKAMEQRSGSVRLLNPQKPVLQILELTRMHRMFEIVHL